MISKDLPDGYFARKFDQSNPGLVLFLLDQSLSMNGQVDGRAKSIIAASAINLTIHTMIERCRRGASIVDKALIGVIGYGAETKYELIGSVSVLNDSYKKKEVENTEVIGPSGVRRTLPVERKVWILPVSENCTPMADALNLATEKLREWVKQFPEAPPPVVINVTDGVPDDLQEGRKGTATRAAASSLRTLGGPSDRCLLLSVHIGSESRTPILFPTHREAVTGPYQQLLFDLSSVVPDELFDLATRKGLQVQRESRLLAINAAPNDLLRILDFGSSASMAGGKPEGGKPEVM